MKIGRVITFLGLDGTQLQGTVWAQGPAGDRGTWWLTRAPARFILVKWSRSHGTWVERQQS